MSSGRRATGIGKDVEVVGEVYTLGVYSSEKDWNGGS